jgi:hypothetical protein
VWHHWALTCFELPPLWNFFFWIDGDLQRGVATEEPFELPCELHWMIGTCDSTGCGGLVDDFRVSSTALYSILDGSEDFVPERELGVRPDTILLLDFDHETGGVIPDVTGNGHDALLLGGSLVPDECHLP